MLAQGLRSFNDLSYTIFGMILFISIFVGVIIWNFCVPRIKAMQDSAALLPFTEEEITRGE